MKHLSAPLNITWWIALILAVVGIILHFVGPITQYAIWFVVASAALLLLATRVKGL
ncbi:MAG: hypothetical protein ACXWEW_09845 [Nitrososphaeraceae archaeon]